MDHRARGMIGSLLYGDGPRPRLDGIRRNACGGRADACGC